MDASCYESGKAVARANLAFYRAIEALDVDAMRAVWSTAPHAKCIHPGWELIAGTESILASWEAIFANTDSLCFDVADLEVEVLGDLAWVSNVEKIRSVVGDERYESEAVATNLFARENGVWKLILHHASPVSQH